MNRKGLTLLEILTIVVVIGIIAVLLPPPGHGHLRRAKVTSCAHNMAQLSKLASVASAKEPAFTLGKEGWLSLSRMKPPLIEAEMRTIFACPVRDEDLASEECDYRGPRVPFSTLSASDPVAADKQGNHGDGKSINVLLKNGSVLEIGPDDPLWKRCNEVLGD